MKYLIFFFLFSDITLAADLREVHIGLASNFSEVSTGSSNPYGGYFKGGVDLALKKAEAKLKSKGILLKTLEFDYGNTDIKVLEAAKKAISSDVVAVIGYNYSSNALLAAPLHHEAKLPMITPSATANRLGQLGRYIHMGAFDNAFMGETLAKIARNRLKATKVVLLPAGNCAYCSDLADSFAREFQKRGGSIAYNLPVLSEDKDFSGIVQKLKGLEYDLIFIPNQELTSARMIAALSKAGIKKPFMGADGWGNVGQEFFGILGEGNFTGYSTSHWHPDLNDSASKEFISAYVKLYAKTPNDTSVLAYDSTLLLVDAILAAKDFTRESIEDSLNKLKSFRGVTGQFILSPNRAPEKSLVLLKTEAHKFKIVEVISSKNRKAL